MGKYDEVGRAAEAERLDAQRKEFARNRAERLAAQLRVNVVATFERNFASEGKEIARVLKRANAPLAKRKYSGYWSSWKGWDLPVAHGGALGSDPYLSWYVLPNGRWCLPGEGRNTGNGFGYDHLEPARLSAAAVRTPADEWLDPAGPGLRADVVVPTNFPGLSVARGRLSVRRLGTDDPISLEEALAAAIQRAVRGE